VVEVGAHLHRQGPLPALPGLLRHPLENVPRAQNPQPEPAHQVPPQNICGTHR
jgi:hypothetical protein